MLTAASEERQTAEADGKMLVHLQKLTATIVHLENITLAQQSTGDPSKPKVSATSLQY